MPRSLTHRSVLVSMLALVLALPTAAMAHGPTACTDGPTRLASADIPHMVDPHADTAAGLGAVHGNAVDLIGSWISGPSAWEDAGSTDKFVATLRVEALDRPSLLVRYYFVFSGAGGERWVRAVFDAPNTWTFGYGTLNGTTYASDGTTTGTVDAAAGTIAIDLPNETLPTRPADGKALDLTLGEASSFIRVPTSTTGGQLIEVDSATDSCTVGLYEAAPVAP